MSNFHTELVRRVRLDDIPARQQGTCKHVLGWIAYHASEEEADIAYPGIETLELETGLRAKAIVTATETLAECEWISKKRRNGTSNIYRLNVRKLREHYVPKDPSKIDKLINELPGLGFSHEHDAGSDADPTPGEPEPETSENAHPQAADQHLCSENTSDVFSEHDGDVLTTRPGCSQDNQTIRESSESRHITMERASATDDGDENGSQKGMDESAAASSSPEPTAAQLHEHADRLLRDIRMPAGADPFNPHTKARTAIKRALTEPGMTEADIQLFLQSAAEQSGWSKQAAAVNQRLGEIDELIQRVRARTHRGETAEQERQQQDDEQQSDGDTSWCGECDELRKIESWEWVTPKHASEPQWHLRLRPCPTCHPKGGAVPRTEQPTESTADLANGAAAALGISA